MKKFFGTDGIRGKVDKFITNDLAYKVGSSLQVLDCQELIIGHDTRESGKALSESLEKGASSAGINVFRAGIVSTPMLSFLSREKQSFGVMITGSHNLYHDNGIKIFKYGKKLSEEDESIIESYLNGFIQIEEEKTPGIITNLTDGFDLYNKIFEEILVPTKLKIALDLANGATFEIGKRIFQSINSNIEVIGDKPDGKNINLGYGSTQVGNLISLVKEKELDIGFAFDGDGDRILAVNSEGRIIDGDFLIYIYANYLKEKGLLFGNTVVLTKMSNLGIIKAFKKKGIDVVLTDVGDKYVFKALEESGYILGGENSGHIINLNLLDTGDGILNAVFLIKILEESKVSLDKLIEDIIIYPEKTYNLKDVKKEILKDPHLQEEILILQNELGSEGKVLVRASGTEEVIRITVSAESFEIVDQKIQELIGILKRY